jgi:hypothetical protein
MVVGTMVRRFALAFFALPLFIRRGTGFIRSWFIISIALIREFRRLAFPLHRRNLVCNVGLVLLGPTQAIPFCQNGSTNVGKCDFGYGSSCLHVVSSYMIPLIGDPVEEHHFLHIGRDGHTIRPKVLKVCGQFGNIICRIASTNFAPHCCFEILVDRRHPSTSKVLIEGGPGCSHCGCDHSSAHSMRQFQCDSAKRYLFGIVPGRLVCPSRSRASNDSGDDAPPSFQLKKTLHLCLPRKKLALSKTGMVLSTVKSWFEDIVVVEKLVRGWFLKETPVSNDPHNKQGVVIVCCLEQQGQQQSLVV